MPLEPDRSAKLEKLWAAIVDHTEDDDMFILGMLLLNQIHEETGFWPAGFEARMDRIIRAARRRGRASRSHDAR